MGAHVQLFIQFLLWTRRDDFTSHISATGNVLGHAYAILQIHGDPAPLARDNMYENITSGPSKNGP